MFIHLVQPNVYNESNKDAIKMESLVRTLDLLCFTLNLSWNANAWVSNLDLEIRYLSVECMLSRRR